MLGKLNSYMQKNETRTFSNTINKNKPKMDKRPKWKTGNLKLLEENIGRTLFDISHSSILRGLSPQGKETKAKINKRDLIKLKGFCIAKGTISKMKRQPIEYPQTI